VRCRRTVQGMSDIRRTRGPNPSRILS
jgi:hypothetical protein